MKATIASIFAFTLNIFASGCTHPTDQPAAVVPPVVYTYPEDSLRHIWSIRKAFVFPSTGHMTPILVGDDIIIAYDTIVERIAKATGKVLWIYGCQPTGADWRAVWGATEMVLEGTNLFGQAGGSFLCLDVTTGVKKWEFDVPGDYFTTCWSRYSQSNDAIFLATRSRSHLLYAISKADGHIIWRTTGVGIDDSSRHLPRGSFGGAPTYDKGRIFVGARYFPGTEPLLYDGGVECYDAATGKRLWNYLFPAPDAAIDYPRWDQLQSTTAANMVVPLDSSVIVTAGFCVAAVSFEGKMLWRKAPHIDLGISDNQDCQSILSNGVYYSYNNGNGNSFAFAMDPQNGRTIWASLSTLAGEPHTILGWGIQLDSKAMYKVTDDNWLIAQDLATGVETWGCHITPYCYADSIDGHYAGSMYVDGERIYFIDETFIHCCERVKR